MDDVVGDAELIGVLEGTLLSAVGDDDAKAVARDVGFEVWGRGPDVFTGVDDSFGQALDGKDVGGWAAEEFDSD